MPYLLMVLLTLLVWTAHDLLQETVHVLEQSKLQSGR